VPSQEILILPRIDFAPREIQIPSVLKKETVFNNTSLLNYHKHIMRQTFEQIWSYLEEPVFLHRQIMLPYHITEIVI
jgi:hypothetical protein